MRHPAGKDIKRGVFRFFFPGRAYISFFFGGGAKLEVSGKINVLIKGLYSIYINYIQIYKFLLFVIMKISSSN